MFKKNRIFIALLLLFSVIFLIIYVINYFGVIPVKYYTSKDFNIEVIHSRSDFNKNGIDDYTDILDGAKKDAENKPKYNGEYFVGGYPPDNIGVCTDVVWRAFKNAGFSLKEMVDEDIKNNIDLYPLSDGKPDPNIDFRRVQDLKVYFDRTATSLTLDVNDIKEWQPGDIVTFGTNHIGIISDKRNKKGIPYLIHNAGQPKREEDVLKTWPTKISGHYRFDASKIVKLISFN